MSTLQHKPKRRLQRHAGQAPLVSDNLLVRAILDAMEWEDVPESINAVLQAVAGTRSLHERIRLARAAVIEGTAEGRILPAAGESADQPEQNETPASAGMFSIRPGSKVPLAHALHALLTHFCAIGKEDKRPFPGRIAFDVLLLSCQAILINPDASTRLVDLLDQHKQLMSEPRRASRDSKQKAILDEIYAILEATQQSVSR